MKERFVILILILSIVLVFAFKLTISLQTESFSEESYFQLRQADHIKETGKPMFHDELSYQGRDYRFMPLYTYVIAFLNPLMKKIITNFFVVISSLLVYFIAFHLTRDKYASLFSGIISLFIPITALISNSALSSMSLFVPLYLLFILFYLKRNMWSSWPLLITLVLLMLTSPITLIIVLGLGAFILIQKIQNIKPGNKDLEITIFSTFLAVWFFVVIYKELLSGWGFLWGNSPANIISNILPATEFFYSVGLLLLLLAAIGLNKIFSKNGRDQLFVLSMSLVFIICYFIGIISITSSLSLLGVTASIIAAVGFKEIIILSEQTKFSLKKILATILIIIFSSTTIIPFIEANINQHLPSQEKIESIKSLNKEEGTIISSPNEAHLIMYYSGMKTYFDNYYPFSNSKERYKNSLLIYQGNSVFDVSKILSQEQINFIFLSDETKSFYSIDYLNAASLGSCINRYRGGEVIIYENKCRIS